MQRTPLSLIALPAALLALGSTLDAMPQNGPQLAADERDTIRRWIAQGAKND